jgi:excisionase family DNA binding protein
MDTDLTRDARMLTPKQLSELLGGIPLPTIYGWRSKGIGPRGYRIGRHVRYRRSDVDEWLRTRQDQPRSA